MVNDVVCDICGCIMNLLYYKNLYIIKFGRKMFLRNILNMNVYVYVVVFDIWI